MNFAQIVYHYDLHKVVVNWKDTLKVKVICTACPYIIPYVRPLTKTALESNDVTQYDCEHYLARYHDFDAVDISKIVEYLKEVKDGRRDERTGFHSRHR